MISIGKDLWTQWKLRDFPFKNHVVWFALGGLCRWQAKVVLNHAKMVISTLATQLGQYMVSFRDFTYCMMINTSWGNVAQCLWWNFCCTYWSVKTLYLTNGKYLFIIIKNYKNLHSNFPPPRMDDIEDCIYPISSLQFPSKTSPYIQIDQNNP